MNEIDIAENILMLFSHDFKKLYGLEKCSFNLHQLTHMADAVKKWGPLWAWSMFPFEDANGYFKKINHGPNKVDAEIMNTMKMINAYYILKSKLFGDIEDNQDEMLLGTIKMITPNIHEIEVLQDLLISNEVHMENGKLSVYTRAKLKNQVFTSEMYTRQKKDVILL